MSPEELNALAEKLEAEAGKRGLERPRTVRRLIVQEGADIDTELARLDKADFTIVRSYRKSSPCLGRRRLDTRDYGPSLANT
jgi:hypothetical protein